MSDLQYLKICPVKPGTCKPNCAWWDEISKSCAVLLLARRFDAVTTTEDKLLVDAPEGYYYQNETTP